MVLEIVAIVLSLTSLAVTVIGYFASAKFYRDGIYLQNKARNALARIDERTTTIRDQFGGVLDRTLDAVIMQASGASPGTGRFPPSDQTSERQNDNHRAPQLPPEGDERAHSALRLYSLQGFRFSDVSSGTQESLFSVGTPYNFNLLERQDTFLYVGYFPDIDPREALARVILVVRILSRAYDQVSDVGGEVLEEAEEVLGKVRIDVLVDAEANVQELDSRFDEATEELTYTFPVDFISVDQLESLIEEELEELGV